HLLRSQPRHGNDVTHALVELSFPLRRIDDHLVTIAPSVLQVARPMVPLVPYDDVANRESVLFDDGTELGFRLPADEDIYVSIRLCLPCKLAANHIESLQGLLKLVVGNP